MLLGAGARWSHDDITQKLATLSFTPPQETDSIYSWFIQDQIKIIPNTLSLILGSKFEHNNRSGFEVQPNGRLLWTPTPHQTVWARVYKSRSHAIASRPGPAAHRLSRRQLRLYFLRVVGSKNFRSERLLGTEGRVPDAAGEQAVSGSLRVPQ